MMKVTIASLILVLFSIVSHTSGQRKTQQRDISQMTVGDLRNKYWEIFHRYNNRNAASHLWASWILDRSENFSEDKIYELFSGFCPISGSPVRPRAGNLYGDIPFVSAADTSQTISGNVQVCCWPCVCDLEEFVKVDTLMVKTSEGPKTFNALVIGDPCKDPTKIPAAAPEVRCVDGKLADATLSTNGHIVIGLMQRKNGPLSPARTAADMSAQCDGRRKNKYRWGMGTIFVDVASINPIE